MNATVDQYSGVTSSGGFGSGGLVLGSSGNGSPFGVFNGTRLVRLVVPTGYTSGGLLSADSTFLNTDFATLGVTEGTYTWTWGSGANADSATLTVGSTTAVPEPMTILGTLTALGFGAVFKRRQAKG